MLSSKQWNSKTSDIKLVYLYSTICETVWPNAVHRAACDKRQNEESFSFDTFYRISILCADHKWRWNSVFCTSFSVTGCQKYPFCSLMSWQNTLLLVFLKAMIWMFRCCHSCVLIDYMQQVLVGLTPSRRAQDITLGQGNVCPFHILSSSLSTFSGETSPLCSILSIIYIYHNLQFWRHYSIILPTF